MTLHFTAAEIEAALPPTQSAAPPVNRTGATRSNVVPLAGQKPEIFSGRHDLPDLNAAAQANLPGTIRFDDLPAAQQNATLRNILTHPAIKKLADQPRVDWLKYLFAIAHAGHCGATEARDLALAWSQSSSRFTDTTDFDRDWLSFKPRAGGVTVGTLFDAAKQAGIDLSQLWNTAPNTSAATTVVTGPSSLATAFGIPPTGAAPFFNLVPSGAANLRAPPWLVFGLLLIGEIAVLAGQGGGAKTAFAIFLAVALAAGLQYAGPFRINTRPGGLRVAIISAEEDAGRIGLLVEAACSVLRLPAAERALVKQNLLIHDAGASGWRLGEPPLGSREVIASEANDGGLAKLKAALALHKLDVLILDTFAALFAIPSEIDNQAVTLLMRRLARAVRAVGCAVLLLHHTPKMTRETAAAQRGEGTLVRGGSGILNAARVAATITSLPAGEASQAAMQGLKPDLMRRIEHAKINDMPPMDPEYFTIVSVPVRVHDGTDHAVRVIQFLPPIPTAGAGGTSDAVRDVAMKAIDAGVLGDHGAKVPLSPGGGRNTRRDGVQAIARALMAAKPGLVEAHARTAAREVLKDLRDRIGCVVEQDV